ncbi:MAG: hypothetical protein JXB39_09255 [Deltaproteobacteria bacterium]|nr:hypothetical protein [Deltaproteobacteria bacterium]
MPAAPPDSGPSRSVHLGDCLDPLAIHLSCEASWESARSDLAVLLGSDPVRFQGIRAHLDIGDRDIDLFELRRLAHALEADHGVLVVALRCSPRSVRRYAERELKLKVLAEEETASQIPAIEPPPAVPETPQPPVPETPPPEEAPEVVEASRVEPEPVEAPSLPEPEEPDTAASRVQVVHRTLRSGSSVRFNGDVVVFGDVHAGAQVTANGSVVILGSLLGLAHAGARGDDAAFVLALDLEPTQIRIGTRIAIPPQAPGGGPPRGAEIAFVREDRIVIEPYRGRLPSSSAQRSVE